MISKNKVRIYTDKRGETVLEVLIAIFVISMMIMQAGQLQISAIRHAKINEYMLIGDLLSSEGVEAMKAFVASNGLRFSSKPECWDSLPSAGLSDCESPQNKIAATTYALHRDPVTLGWSLLQSPVLDFAAQMRSLDAAGIRAECSTRTAENFRVMLFESPSDYPADCTRVVPNVNVIGYNSLYYSSPNSSPLYNMGRQTSYYRGIKVTSIDSPPPVGERLSLAVEASVAYKNLGKWEVVKSSIILDNTSDK